MSKNDRKKNINGKKKKVNVGIEGHTPKKIFQLSSFNKKVNVGEEGHTPVKLFNYNNYEAPIIDSFSYDNGDEDEVDNRNSFGIKLTGYNSENSNKNNSNEYSSPPLELPMSPVERPKTSRGKSHPSPDEFFSYVVPSPEAERVRNRRERIAVQSDSDSERIAKPLVLKRFRRNKTKARQGSDTDSRVGYSSGDNDDMMYIEAADDGHVYNAVTGEDVSADPDNEAEELSAEIKSYQIESDDDAIEEIISEQRYRDMLLRQGYDYASTVELSGDDADGEFIDAYYNDNLETFSADDDSDGNYPRNNDLERERKVRMLGCWLFGSVLRI